MITALIADDEPLAREYLRYLLESHSVQVVGEAEDGVEAIQLAEDLQPDLVLLDVQMPGLTGMQAASALLQLDAAPLIVFVTGYSEHAVAAFEHDTLDYLVKPVSPERMAVTLVRASERRADKQARQVARRRVVQRATASPTLRRLPVRMDYSVRLIRLEEILCAIAREKRVFVRTPEGEHRTYYTLKQLESLLPVDRFLRVHDSYLINLDAVEELLFLGDHAYEVRLSNKERIPVSRTRYPELQRRLGLGNLTSS